MGPETGGHPRFEATLQLRAVLVHDDASEDVVTPACTWWSDRREFVEVDDAGLCRKVAPGPASITAEYVHEGHVLTGTIKTEGTT